MSMYSKLLASALDIGQGSDDVRTASAALTYLRECRRQLGRTLGVPGEHGTGVTPLSSITSPTTPHSCHLARLLGIACDVDEYDRPDKARARLETDLSRHGVLLDGIEPPSGLG